MQKILKQNNQYLYFMILLNFQTIKLKIDNFIKSLLRKK